MFSGNYYSFGALMPGRTTPIQTAVDLTSAGTKPYRYGFNGKESDFEVKNIGGSQQDYGMRIYDPRLGRFLSVDPLTAEYPFYTPYQFAGNTPIQAVDLDGLEPDFKFEGGQNGDGYFGRWDAAMAKVEGKSYEEVHSRNQKQNGKAAVAASVIVVGGYAMGAVGTLSLARVGWWATNPANLQMLWEGAALVGGVAYAGSDDLFPNAKGDELAKMFKGTGIKVLDFFGGQISKYADALNIDKAAKQGFKGSISEFTQFMKNNKLLGSVDKIVSDNPFGYDEYLNDAAELLKSGGTMTVSGTMSNKYFSGIVNGTMKGLGNFEVIQTATKVSSEGMKTTEGKAITGDMFQVVLKRK